MKTALITGITGQDGSYLAELLLEKGYKVHGLVRRSSSFNTARIDHILKDSHETNVKLLREYGDLSDSSNLSRVIERIKPDEIYNLGAQSHVRVSFNVPEYTADVTGLGVLRLLDAIKESRVETKFYQASSSEIFGSSLPPQNEETKFQPQSPYACAKLFGYWTTINYRDGYNLFASNGILFNHESPRRGETFVTRKITRGLSQIKLGSLDCLYMGNLDAKRDWGYAKEYVEGMWLMLQHEKPDDFVLATGEMHSVREFIEKSADLLGFQIRWQGEGLKEVGLDSKTGRVIIRIDPYFFRPTEVNGLQGDYSKAKNILGWVPKVTFGELAEIMVKSDFDKLRRKHPNV